MGIYRQTVFHAQKFGWNSDFEALAAGIATRFIP
jgi:hypothetical protein